MFQQLLLEQFLQQGLLEQLFQQSLLQQGTTMKQMFVPTIIVETVVPTMIVGTAVPTIIVLTAYYWKSCVTDYRRGYALQMISVHPTNFWRGDKKNYRLQLKCLSTFFVVCSFGVNKEFYPQIFLIGEQKID